MADSFFSISKSPKSRKSQKNPRKTYLKKMKTIYYRITLFQFRKKHQYNGREKRSKSFRRIEEI